MLKHIATIGTAALVAAVTLTDSAQARAVGRGLSAPTVRSIVPFRSIASPGTIRPGVIVSPPIIAKPPVIVRPPIKLPPIVVKPPVKPPVVIVHKRIYRPAVALALAATPGGCGHLYAKWQATGLRFWKLRYFACTGQLY